jgi:hypothetical protein
MLHCIVLESWQKIQQHQEEGERNSCVGNLGVKLNVRFTTKNKKKRLSTFNERTVKNAFMHSILSSVLLEERIHFSTTVKGRRKCNNNCITILYQYFESA